MAVPWSMTMRVAGMVWAALSGWLSVCFIIADEIARSLHRDEFHGE